ncbi:MAG TPA: hypothetical protein DEG17_07860 [Cyanobacteria bacterium UBA11149]|nr:hypothetical protein [Cyanobacteria bacterium UBA11367]HBE60167.1 hypothetical protein [Cyanobacteria bacterium UBA11366]HBK64877.1 hypothetical protein [Cyanobacteria bacterium UBA11166]HBR75486.1 hypothetical protein [Cyanobacteria bacterium UBA11159]HBS70584.1 hypothetical protein [Cyanobacteria bacterium UBA11153]HBW88776.1 hypothetical protein [Cyanobacteria bacterium UBA11149]HCA98224.1 hypothetical protein [Cyanobacteria bacterium UBA9226]
MTGKLGLGKDKLSPNLRSLDALRGILAVYVLFGHCRWLLWAGNSVWNQQDRPWWSDIIAIGSAGLRYGHEAVMVFFVLSGFFIHLRVSDRLAKRENIQFNFIQFLQRRCYRLIPPYILALILTVSLDLVGRFYYPTLYSGLTGDPLLDDNFVRKEFSLVSVIPALLMLPSSLGKDFGTNGPLWSLAYEVIYYLLYPLWVRLRRVGVFPAYLAGILLAIISSFFIEWNFLRQVLIHYPIWLSGAAMAEILTKMRLPKWSLFINIFFMVIAFTILQLQIPIFLLICSYTILGCSIFLIAASIPQRAIYHKCHKFCESLGKESYTIYICHFPIVSLISAWSIEVLGTRPVHGWLAVGGAVLTLSISHICFCLCERHFLSTRLSLK